MNSYECMGCGAMVPLLYFQPDPGSPDGLPLACAACQGLYPLFSLWTRHGEGGSVHCVVATTGPEDHEVIASVKPQEAYFG